MPFLTCTELFGLGPDNFQDVEMTWLSQRLQGGKYGFIANARYNHLLMDRRYVDFLENENSNVNSKDLYLL